MRNLVTGVPFAGVVSVALVALGAVVVTQPATGGSWVSHLVAAVALFAAIVTTGTAIRRRGRGRSR